MALIDHWVRLRGLRAPAPDDAPVIERDWRYAPSRIGHYTRYLRLTAIGRRRGFPASATIAAPFPAARWRLYFMYLPDGRIGAAHRYTLARLRTQGARLLVVVASPGRDAALEAELVGLADALIWKELAGFDFSAYALGIAAIARRSPGASLFAMNDSVLGPFGDLDRLLARARWDLTGLTASSRIENHIQSYAFHLASVTPRTLDALRPVLSQRHAYDRYADVIYAQETRLARIAARRLSVGALWYTDHPLGDPSLYAATTLLDEGYPFIKRKLLSEHRRLYPAGRIEAILRLHDHPPMDAEGAYASP